MEKTFKEAKGILIKLLALEMPAAFIQLYFCFGSSSFAKYMLSLKNDGWQGKITPLGDSIPSLLKLYAYRSYPTFGMSTNDFSGLEFDKMLYALNQILNVKKIDEILKVATPPIQRLQLFRYEEGFPPSYKKFIDQLNQHNEFNCKKVSLFNDLVHGLSTMAHIYYSVNEIDEVPTAIADELLKNLANHIADEIKPRLMLDTCIKLHRMFETTLSENEWKSLCMFHGLGQPKLTPKEISERLGISYGRILQLKDKALRRCRHSARLNILFEPLREEEVPALDIQASQITLHPVASENLPKNIELILTEYLEVEYMEDICAFTRSDILKFRGVGIKAVTRIEDAMMVHDLYLKR